MRRKLGTFGCLLLMVGSACFAGAASASQSREQHQRPGTLTEAQSALRRAQHLFHPERSDLRSTGPTGHASREATVVLRDLAFEMDELPARDQRTARRILARPTDGAADPDENGYRAGAEVTCSEHLCFHWVASTEDAPPPADLDTDGVPDWVETNMTVFENVYGRIVTEFGYRPPLTDESSPDHGPDGRLDIYLAELGADHLYGYCTTDDPAVVVRSDVSAYCVMDDDFDPLQYGGRDARRSLQVTAAHEFFHAVQAAYDLGEDTWMLEGTATWMEDEVYDSVNDNRQYFPDSPLVLPHVPVDYAPEGYGYGSWVFWRFLCEYFGDRSVVRRIWERADAGPTGRDEYSIEAVRKLTAARGTSFARTFADFGAVNRLAKRWYDEGGSYPQAPVAATLTLTRATPGTGWRYAALDHLTSIHVKLRPGQSLTGRWRLAVALDLPKTFRGSAATVAVHRKDGSVRWVDVRLSSSGDARVTLPFTRSAIGYVVLTMTNASTRYDCWYGASISCSGIPKDDGLKHWFKARAVR